MLDILDEEVPFEIEILFIAVMIGVIVTSLGTAATYYGNLLTFETQINNGNNVKIIATFNESKEIKQIQFIENNLEQLVFEKTFNNRGNLKQTKKVIKEIIIKEIKKEKYNANPNLILEKIEIIPKKEQS